MAEIETGRRVVAASECDTLGHANIASYIAYVSDSGFAMMNHVGLGRDNILGGRRLGIAVVDMQAQYKAELLPGDCIHLRTGLLSTGTKSMVFRHRIYRSRSDGSEQLVFVGRFTKVLMDLEARRAIAIPEDIKDKLETLRLAPAEEGETT